MNCNILEFQHASGTRAMNSSVQNVEEAWQPASLDEQGPSTAHSQKGSTWKVEAWMVTPLKVLTELASINFKRSRPSEEVTDNPQITQTSLPSSKTSILEATGW